jgi:hypothetical protein
MSVYNSKKVLLTLIKIISLLKLKLRSYLA